MTTHRQRVAAWRHKRTTRRRRALAALVTVGWLWWWVNGAPAWTLPAVFGVVGWLLASTSRRWTEPVPAPDWQASMDHRDPPLHIVRDEVAP